LAVYLLIRLFIHHNGMSHPKVKIEN